MSAGGQTAKTISSEDTCLKEITKLLLCVSVFAESPYSAAFMRISFFCAAVNSKPDIFKLCVL